MLRSCCRPLQDRPAGVSNHAVGGIAGAGDRRHCHPWKHRCREPGRTRRRFRCAVAGVGPRCAAIGGHMQARPLEPQPTKQSVSLVQYRASMRLPPQGCVNVHAVPAVSPVSACECRRSRCPCPAVGLLSPSVQVQVSPVSAKVSGSPIPHPCWWCTRSSLSLLRRWRRSGTAHQHLQLVQAHLMPQSKPVMGRGEMYTRFGSIQGGFVLRTAL